MYKAVIRPLLFTLPAEKAHHTTFSLLKFIHRIPGMAGLFRRLFCYKNPALKRELFGLEFDNPVGLAAGFDKDARLIDELSTLGFGFIEIGTITPKGQPGNPKPRLFRLPQDQSLINRMGFNNEGMEAAIRRLKKRKSKVIVGGNIGKNKVTPNEQAESDYLQCYHALYPYVDYFVINVSSPNTPGLRELQEKEPLQKLIQRMQLENNKQTKPKPVLLKIAPDLTDAQLDDILDIMEKTKLDGLIATNTTIARAPLTTDKQTIEAIGAGGLSGKALTQRSTEVISYLHKKSKGAFPIVGVGGILSPEDALEKLKAGASLIQVYTGFIYEGPAMVKRINQYLSKAAF